MPDQTPASQSAEICGEVGTSFTTDHEPHYTDPCLLPADHDELHDWAQREAAGEPSPAELATAEDQQFATIKTATATTDRRAR